MTTLALKDYTIGAVIVVGVLTGIALFISWARPTIYSAEPRFSISQRVQLHLAPDIPAMVIDHYCNSLRPRDACRYQVRLTAPQDRTDVALLGADGPITHQPLSTLWVAEYEIRERY